MDWPAADEWLFCRGQANFRCKQVGQSDAQCGQRDCSEQEVAQQCNDWTDALRRPSQDAPGKVQTNTHYTAVITVPLIRAIHGEPAASQPTRRHSTFNRDCRKICSSNSCFVIEDITKLKWCNRVARCNFARGIVRKLTGKGITKMSATTIHEKKCTNVSTSTIYDNLVVRIIAVFDIRSS